MFHRVLAASVIGAAAMAVPATAMAADSGGGGGAATPTSVAVHLPAHVRAGEPVTVSARIIPQDAAQEPGTGIMRPGGHKGADHGGTKGGKSGKAGKGTAKGGGHKGAGHGTGRGKGKSRAGHHAVTGEVRFFLDGKAESPVEVSRDQASEKLEIPLGRHTVVAEYSGDADYLAARSAPVSFELTPGQVGDPGQDQNQDPDGFGQDLPGAPDQGTNQYGPGQDDQDPGDQGVDQDQDDQDPGDQGIGQSTPDQGADQA
jgi:hypothetical protein